MNMIACIDCNDTGCIECNDTGEHSVEEEQVKNSDTEPVKITSRERALLLLQEDPELFRAVLKLDEELYWKKIEGEITGSSAAEDEYFRNIGHITDE